MFAGSGVAYQSVGLGATTDAVLLPAWSASSPAMAAAADQGLGFPWRVNHNWAPYWSTSLFGSYSSVRYDGRRADLHRQVYWRLVRPPGLTYSCDPDFNASQLGVVTRWTPVKNFTFSAEVLWFHLDQKFTGPADPLAGRLPSRRLYEFKDQDTVCWNFAFSATSDLNFTLITEPRQATAGGFAFDEGSLAQQEFVVAQVALNERLLLGPTVRATMCR